MNDMLATIKPKTDQLNADDLIGRDLTIKITSVKIKPGTEQPVDVFFEGDNGKPYRPCKSMRRVMVKIWGPDANDYAGKSMTLFRDDGAIFGGVAVGGIRISHISGITKPVTMALTATKASRKPFTVHPLAETPKTTGHRMFQVQKSDGATVEFPVTKPGFEAALKALWADLPAVAFNGALLAKMSGNQAIACLHDEIARLITSGTPWTDADPDTGEIDDASQGDTP